MNQQLQFIYFHKIQQKDSSNIYLNMDKVTQLIQKIRKWNMMGYTPLPELQLVIITGKATYKKSQHLVQLFKSEQLPLKEQYCRNNQQQSNQIYRIFEMGEPLHGRLHLALGLSDTSIRDTEFRIRKKLIQKLRRQKNTIFILFNNQDKRELQKNQQYFAEFGLNQGYSFQRVIFYEGMDEGVGGSGWNRLLKEIVKRYEIRFRFEVVMNYRIMKQQKKLYQNLTKRYLQWSKVITGQFSPLNYSLLSIRFYIQVMKSSFAGTYSSNNNYQLFGIKKSINWITMELFNQFWDRQCTHLLKVVDSFQLGYIEQQYKMQLCRLFRSDYYSIGGFLPDTCFKSIFSAPLFQFKNQLIALVENIKQCIVQHIELAISYTFKHTSIKQQLLGYELTNIEEICDGFIEELQHAVESQIEYVHAHPEDYWGYRQINSNIYSPDKQIYIEIKYIGKTYIRKVFDNIKNMVPRFIGQGLLKRIIKYLSEGSINTFIEITRQKKFQIVIEKKEVEIYQKNLSIVKQLQELLVYWSMKVNASFLIKNFHEKKQKQWQRMFGSKQKILVDDNEQKQKYKIGEKGGFLDWMKNIFKLGKKKKKIKRCQSGEKSFNEHQQISIDQQQRDTLKDKQINKNNTNIISQKNWLLIINTGRQVSTQRIKTSATQGFISRFRSSIWMYLSSNTKQKLPKLKTILLQSQPQQLTLKQIQKDIDRTRPIQLFHYTLRNTLKNVLLGYSIHDRQVAYTQGMNFICAAILCTLVNYGQVSSPLIDQKINYQQLQQKAFCIFNHIMFECGVRKLMLLQPDLISNMCLIIHDRIKDKAPQIDKLIQQKQFNCQALFTSALISCLSNVSKNINLIKRFFDMLITNNFIVICKIIGVFIIQCQFMIDEVKKKDVFQFFSRRMYDQVYEAVGDEGLSKMFQNI